MSFRTAQPLFFTLLSIKPVNTFLIFTAKAWKFLPRIKPVLLWAGVMTIQLTGCAVGPDYVRPQTQVAAEFKELKGWKQAQPRDASLPGKWWEIFNDPKLNELEEQVAVANQSIAQAEAQYRQAQNLVQSVQSSFLPTAMLTGTMSRF
ncbi:MAG: hypothetical protein ACXV7J_03245, partial [Methylomonas sp.]